MSLVSTAASSSARSLLGALPLADCPALSVVGAGDAQALRAAPHSGRHTHTADSTSSPHPLHRPPLLGYSAPCSIHAHYHSLVSRKQITRPGFNHYGWAVDENTSTGFESREHVPFADSSRPAAVSHSRNDECALELYYCDHDEFSR